MEREPTTHLVVEIAVFLTAAITFVVTAIAIMSTVNMARKGEGGVPWLLSVVLALFVAGAALLAANGYGEQRPLGLAALAWSGPHLRVIPEKGRSGEGGHEDGPARR